MAAKRPSRAVAPVRFAPEHDDDADMEVDDGADAEDNTVDVLSLVQEFQKKNARKSTSRSTAFQTKKNALIVNARKEADEMVREGSTYIEQCEFNVQQLKNQEARSDTLIKEVFELWITGENSVKGLLSLYPTMINDLAPRRAHDINAANEMLETHPQSREASRRKVMKAAKKAMKVGLENQRLATDASALIKSYKELLLS